MNLFVFLEATAPSQAPFLLKQQISSLSSALNGALSIRIIVAANNVPDVSVIRHKKHWLVPFAKKQRPLVNNFIQVFRRLKSLAGHSLSETLPAKSSGKPIWKKTKTFGVTKLPESKSTMVWPKITLFGDSITRQAFDPNNGCWASMLANKVGDYFDVDIRGFSGYNSSLALELVPRLFPRSYLEQVEIFVIFFGHNDSWKSPNPIHVPVDQYAKNMHSIIHHLLSNGVDNSKIVLITPTWLHEPSFSKFTNESGLPPLHKDFNDASKYAQAIVRLAQAERIEYLDAFSLSHKHEPLEELFSDGLHYSFKGAKLLFDNLMPIIDRKIEERFKKPTTQLFHATPFDEIPEVKAHIRAHAEKLKAEKRQT